MSRVNPVVTTFAGGATPLKTTALASSCRPIATVVCLTV